ncbi:MAG: HEPN domain-containing protein [Euryarchaeota archaeon]|nr:HEPN domain-containing protein [Euryarchaeota archaeon]
MRKNKAAAEIWLNKAKDYLTFAKAGWKESGIISDTCVLCQQAAEKALKALLELENIDVEKTPPLKIHRLAEIIEECKRYYPKVERFKDDCDKLTVYYFDRYPAEIPLNLTEEDAAFALAVAEKILNFVEGVISST